MNIYVFFGSKGYSHCGALMRHQHGGAVCVRCTRHRASVEARSPYEADLLHGRARAS